MFKLPRATHTFSLFLTDKEKLGFAYCLFDEAMESVAKDLQVDILPRFLKSPQMKELKMRYDEHNAKKLPQIEIQKGDLELITIIPKLGAGTF